MRLLSIAAAAAAVAFASGFISEAKAEGGAPPSLADNQAKGKKELEDMAKIAREASARDNCNRRNVFVARMWEIYQQENNPFWARHQLDANSATVRGPLLAYIRDEVEKINSIPCPKVKPAVAPEPQRPRRVAVQPRVPAPPFPMSDAGLVRFYTGLYVGFALGGGRMQADWLTTNLISLGLQDVLVDAAKEMRASMLAYDVYVGYLWYTGDEWAAGVEADLTYWSVKMDPGIPGTAGLPGAGGNDSVTVKANWGGAVRARLGRFITPGLMVYGTVGPTFLTVESTVNCASAGVCGANGIPPFNQTHSETLVGWTAGGGIEAIISGGLRARLEYRYADYGTMSANFGTPANLALAADIKLKSQTTKVGVSYAFGGGR